MENELITIDENEFNIDFQYQEYLKNMSLSEALMHPAQQRETKRAFVGGMAQMMLLFMNVFPNLTDEQIDATFGSLSVQIGGFFTAEASKPLIILP